MNKHGTAALLGAAVMGLLGATASAAEKGKMTKGAADDLVPCYGVNKCAGHGKCGGEGHACAGNNKCKGQGWLNLPKSACEEIEGGSLTPPKAGDTPAPAPAPTRGN